MATVVLRPSRELLEQASANLMIYAILRHSRGRDAAFGEWCSILELDPSERAGLAHTRIQLLQDLAAGRLTYDDIDWSGVDDERRASSTGTEFVDTLESWFSGA
jgi:hypothetical protein